MGFNRKTFLALVVVYGTCVTIVMASDLSEASPVRNMDVKLTDKKANEKEEANEKATVGKKSSMVDTGGNFDNTAGVGRQADDKKKEYKDVLKRKKRSISANPMDTTTAADMIGNEEEEDDNVMMRVRSAKANLTKHLWSLPVSQEKTIPLVYTDDGEEKVIIHIWTRVITILDVNDVEQTIETVLHVIIEWRDEALAWNRSLHEGVEMVTMSPDSFWTPPIFVTNSKDLTEIVKETKLMKVTHDGNVTAHIPIVLNTFCAMDLTQYPYDEQTCIIQFFQDSSYFEYKVEVTTSEKDSYKSLALSSEWQLTNVSTRLYWVGSIYQNPEVVISLTRKSLFYSVCLIMPMVLTSYMNTLVFLVPLHNGEKISFLISLVVSTSVFTSFFSTMMPRGLDTMPISMKLYLVMSAQSILVLLATLLVLKKFHAEQTASADSTTGSQGNDLRNRHGGEENDSAVKQPPESNRTSTARLQSLQELPQSGGGVVDSTARLPPYPHRSASIAPLDLASCTTRRSYFSFSGLTASQLDRILFVVFMIVNTACIFVLLYAGIK